MGVQFELRQILDGFFTADVVGRAKFANGFVNEDLLDIVGVAPAIFTQKTQGKRVQGGLRANPSASTVDLTGDAGLNLGVADTVDPEGLVPGVCSLLESAGGPEFDTTGGLVGAAARERSSLIAVADANNEAIANGNDRVWAVLTTPTRTAGDPHTLRFYSGDFGSGSETPYVMNQDFKLLTPQLFDLNQLPTFNDAIAVFFDDSAAGILPGSITDSELSPTIEAYGPNILGRRKEHQLCQGWYYNGTPSEVTGAPTMEVQVLDGVMYRDDGSRTEFSSQSIPIAAADAVENRIDRVVMDSSGSFVVRQGANAPGIPTAPSLNPGDVELCLVQVPSAITAIVNGLISDRRPSTPFSGRMKREYFDGDGVSSAFILQNMPSAVNNESEPPYYMMRVVYNGQEIDILDDSIPTGPATVTECRLLPEPGSPTVVLGAAPIVGTRNVMVEYWYGDTGV